VELSALLATSSQHSKVESSCTTATEKDSGTSQPNTAYCVLFLSALPRIANPMGFFTPSDYGRPLPTRSPCIDNREKLTSWLADTLSRWMQLVLTDIKITPPDGVAWMSHSLRKDATTAAYAIGVNMHNIKFLGG
jgi:hypothetical protein